ncbi:S8 family peptidase [Limibacter armeniacum]|uniref:S8 family peptidase n=1 Tax=Limibacter armeniacum TaxID=466084 RepID=UPI002FE4FC4C
MVDLKKLSLMGLLAVNISLGAAAYNTVSAQDSDPLRGAPENWFNLDKEKGGVYGIGTEAAYNEILKGKKSTKVVVAVIDSGIDIDHEDLKDIIWTNEKEIAGNGKDDDNNGYIDDVHGWNFIGGANGENVSEDNLEVTREFARLNAKYGDKTEEEISKADKKEFEYYQQVKESYDKGYQKSLQSLMQYSAIQQEFLRSKKLMEAYFGVEEVPLDSLSDFSSPDENVMLMAELFKELKAQGVGEEDLQEAVDYFTSQVKYSYNTDFNSREVIGDDYANLKEKGYGNNDVIGPGAEHGTHVAGIIGAVRNNNLGIKGVADNVEIMVLRAVPDGDERDKDIANAIRYAADNGARVINMSFGKAFSPDKEAVDEAVKYAIGKGVLFVHAAGNDNKNTDKESNFPSANYLKGGYAKNWIEVGALNWKDDETMPATFSNYAKKRVDIFAPGVDIYSTVPGSKYEAYNGTSMASPVVAGAAAVLMSYYPSMSAADVKKVLIKSAIDMKKKEVYLPGYKRDLAQGKEPEKVKFGELSNSGGIVNLYNAVKYADKRYK